MKVLLWTLCFFFLTPPLFAAEEPVPNAQILKVEPKLDEDRQSLEFTFGGDYSQSLSYLFDPGVFQMILPHASFDPKLAITRINNQFISELRLKQEGKNTIVEVRFADTNFDAAGKAIHQAQFEKLTLFLYKKPPEPQVFGGSPAPAPQEGAETPVQPRLITDNPVGSLSGYDIFLVLIALALVLGLAYAGLWIYNRYFLDRLNLKRGKYEIRLASQFHLGPKQKVVILEVNGMAFACGVTASQIGVIAQVDQSEFSRFMKGRTNETIDFAGLREEYRASRLAQTQAEKPPEVEANFARELIEKIKKLKPID